MIRSGILFFIIGFILASKAMGQVDTVNSDYAAVDTLNEDFGLFTSDEILDVSLRFDVKEYMRKRPKEEYMEALLTYHISATDSINKEIRLKSRGNFRYTYCSFPPIMINVKNSQFETSDSGELSKIKLVTHCNLGIQENVLREYLIYKLYNVLTGFSFKTRLLNINYIDSQNKRKTITTYGFLIEPVDLLEIRTNSLEIEKENLSPNSIVPEMMDRMAIFNYMIGNTDWSVPGLHNCKVFVSQVITGSNLASIVPYDFDYAGLVNASYAVPREGLPIKSVRERYYEGICRSNEEYQQNLLEFSEHKEDFYRIINEFPYMKERTKKDMIRYLDNFYREIDNNFVIINHFKSTCKDL